MLEYFIRSERVVGFDHPSVQIEYLSKLKIVKCMEVCSFLPWWTSTDNLNLRRMALKSCRGVSGTE